MYTVQKVQKWKVKVPLNQQLHSTWKPLLALFFFFPSPPTPSALLPALSFLLLPLFLFFCSIILSGGKIILLFSELSILDCSDDCLLWKGHLFYTITAFHILLLLGILIFVKFYNRHSVL